MNVLAFEFGVSGSVAWPSSPVQLEAAGAGPDRSRRGQNGVEWVLALREISWREPGVALLNLPGK